MMITSKDNPQIRELRKLQEKRFRARHGQFAAEGEDLILAALAAGWTPLRIFHAPDAPEEVRANAVAWEVDYEVLASASSLGSGTRAIGVFEQLEPSEPRIGDLALFAEGVSDPGNVGTLVRSAAAFSDSPLLLAPGCADPWSPKALRAGMGATFANPPAIDALLPGGQTTVVALDAGGDVGIDEVDLSGPVVICAGAERTGLSAETAARADVTVRIPMRGGGPESLNVAVAASIALQRIAGITA